MRVIVLAKDTIYNGIQHRKGDVIQVDDGVKPTPTKPKDTFDESCIGKVLKGEPIKVKNKNGKTK